MKQILLLLVSLLTVGVVAGNPPDPSKSTISGTQAPADGLTSSSVTVVLRDANGNTISTSDSIAVSSTDPTTTFNPSSVTLDGSGTFYTQMKSKLVGNVPVLVKDNTTRTEISGSVYFYQPGTSPPASGACTSSVPTSPKLTNALSTGAREIALTWTSSGTNVSHYLVSYGDASGSYQYGSPNVGNSGTTSYTVGFLQTGKRYFFVVRAANGCAVSGTSNELSAVAGAVNTPTPTPNTDDPELIFSSRAGADSPTVTPTSGVSAPREASFTPGEESRVQVVVGVATALGILILASVGVWLYSKRA